MDKNHKKLGRKMLHFLCTINFEVTWPFWKMCELEVQFFKLTTYYVVFRLCLPKCEMWPTRTSRRFRQRGLPSTAGTWMTPPWESSWRKQPFWQASSPPWWGHSGFSPNQLTSHGWLCLRAYPAANLSHQSRMCNWAVLVWERIFKFQFVTVLNFY